MGPPTPTGDQQQQTQQQTNNFQDMMNRVMAASQDADAYNSAQARSGGMQTAGEGGNVIGGLSKLAQAYAMMAGAGA